MQRKNGRGGGGGLTGKSSRKRRSFARQEEELADKYFDGEIFRTSDYMASFDGVYSKGREYFAQEFVKESEHYSVRRRRDYFIEDELLFRVNEERKLQNKSKSFRSSKGKDQQRQTRELLKKTTRRGDLTDYRTKYDKQEDDDDDSIIDRPQPKKRVKFSEVNANGSTSDDEDDDAIDDKMDEDDEALYSDGMEDFDELHYSKHLYEVFGKDFKMGGAQGADVLNAMDRKAWKDPNYLKNVQQGRKKEDGMTRWAKFEQLLESGLPYSPYGFQRKFLDTIKPAIAPFVFGDDWPKYRAQMCRERGWDINSSKFAMGIAPRRFGKSVSVARIALAVALCVPNSKQAIFSTGKRASGNMLGIIKDLLYQANLQHLIKHSNQEKLVLRGETPDDERVISSFPSRAKISIQNINR